MAKRSKNSLSVKRPSLDLVLVIFPEVCKELGFDKEPMYDFDDENISKIKYYLDLPFNVVFGEEKYKTLEEKAAEIFYFVTSSQAFPNGNKRTGIILTLLLLIWNDKYLKVHPDELYDFSLVIANNHTDTTRGLALVTKFIEKNIADLR